MAYSSAARLCAALRNCWLRPRTGAWRAWWGCVIASVSRRDEERRHIARLPDEDRLGIARDRIAVQAVVPRAQAVSFGQEAGFGLAFLGPRRVVEVHAQGAGDLSAARREAFQAGFVTRGWCRVTRNGVRLVAAGAGPEAGEAGEPLVSVVPAENHTRQLRSLRFVLEMDDGVGGARRGDRPRDCVGPCRPDVLVFDPRLVEDSGSDAVRCVPAQAPRSEIVVLTTDESRALASRRSKPTRWGSWSRTRSTRSCRTPCARLLALGGLQARACAYCASLECKRPGRLRAAPLVGVEAPR